MSNGRLSSARHGICHSLNTWVFYIRKTWLNWYRSCPLWEIKWQIRNTPYIVICTSVVDVMSQNALLSIKQRVSLTNLPSMLFTEWIANAIYSIRTGAKWCIGININLCSRGHTNAYMHMQNKYIWCFKQIIKIKRRMILTAWDQDMVKGWIFLAFWFPDCCVHFS